MRWAEHQTCGLGAHVGVNRADAWAEAMAEHRHGDPGAHIRMSPVGRTQAMISASTWDVSRGDACRSGVPNTRTVILAPTWA